MLEKHTYELFAGRYIYKTFTVFTSFLCITMLHG